MQNASTPVLPAGIHFGRFVRQQRVAQGLSRNAFAALVGVTEKRIYDIEQMLRPAVHETTFIGLARALGLAGDELQHAWSTTAVDLPPSAKARSARQYGSEALQIPGWPEACAALKVDPHEALRRLCRWFLCQEPRVAEDILASAGTLSKTTATLDGTATQIQAADPASPSFDGLVAQVTVGRQKSINSPSKDVPAESAAKPPRRVATPRSPRPR